MKKTAPIILGTLAAIAAAAFPAMSAAHEGPEDAVAIATALKNPLLAKGTARVTIVHVQKGCHSWSLGKGTPAAGVKVVLKRGQRLTVVNQDLDTHKLMRIAGPKIALGKPMAMNGRATLTFKTPGVYRLHTHLIEMTGMPEVETMGPDNVLAMLVVVR
jgi:plastocyanin